MLMGGPSVVRDDKKSDDSKQQSKDEKFEQLETKGLPLNARISFVLVPDVRSLMR